MAIIPDELPPESFQATAFAESLAESFKSQGKSALNLFVLLAGLLAGRDNELASSFGAYERYQ